MRNFLAEAALLERIREEPQNSALRSEFAALIEEHEAGQAALIRGNARQADLAPETLPATLQSSMDSLRNGFFELDAFHFLEGADFLKDHEALFRWAPFTRCLDLWFASEQIAQLAVLPSLRRYTTLNFWDACLFRGRAAQLARSPHLEQLEVLGLYDSNLYDEDLIPVLRSTAFPELRELDIGNQREGQDYTFEGFKVLAESAFAPTLEVLKMNRRYFDEDITPIIRAVPRLHHLEIEGLGLGDVGLTGLVELGREWTTLRIDRCGVTAQGVNALARSVATHSLTDLDIGSNKMGEEGLNALLAAPFKRLRRLIVTGRECGVSSAFGSAMCKAPMASTLEELDLRLACLGPAGAVAFSRAPLHALRRLNVHLNGIGDEGLAAIASSPTLGALRFLDVSQNEITDVGGRALLESPYLEELGWLELGGAELSEGVREGLKSRFGEHVYFEYPWNRR